MSSSCAAWTQAAGDAGPRALRGVCVVLSVLFVLVSPVVASAEPARQIASGDFYAPRFSPDGKVLLVAGPRMHGLSRIDVQTGKATVLLDEAAAGVHARFLADGRVGFKARRAGVLRDLALSANGSVIALRQERPLAFAHQDRIYLRTDAGPMRIGSGDSFFAPQMSPDNSKLAFVGLATGIYVYEVATRQLIHVGPGTSPSWAPDSERLAYEWTEDDGHSIVASDLWIWRKEEGSQRLTATEERLERHPSFSLDGKSLAFDDNVGAVYTMPLAVTP